MVCCVLCVDTQKAPGCSREDVWDVWCVYVLKFFIVEKGRDPTAVLQGHACLLQDLGLQVSVLETGSWRQSNLRRCTPLAAG